MAPGKLDVQTQEGLTNKEADVKKVSEDFSAALKVDPGLHTEVTKQDQVKNEEIDATKTQIKQDLNALQAPESEKSAMFTSSADYVKESALYQEL